MHQYILRRLFVAVPTLLVVIIATFLLMRVAPGDVIEIMLAQGGAGVGATEVNKETMQRIRQELGLGEPLYIQAAKYVSGLLKGDFGRSLYTGTSTWNRFWKGAKVTFELSLIAFGLSVIIGIPIGIFSAIRQDTKSDYMGRLVAIVGISMPDFWLGTMALVFPAIWWGYQAPLGYRELWVDPWTNFQQFIIPAVVIGFRGAATDMRIMRSQMLEVLREDYIRTARSKGLSEWRVVARHALRNAIIPVVTLWGSALSRILGGTVIIEQIFTLPGVGTLTLGAINNRDYTQIQTNVLILGFFIILGNLFTDVSYAFIDPRIRYH